MLFDLLRVVVHWVVRPISAVIAGPLLQALIAKDIVKMHPDAAVTRVACGFRPALMFVVLDDRVAPRALPRQRDAPLLGSNTQGVHPIALPGRQHRIDRP